MANHEFLKLYSVLLKYKSGYSETVDIWAYTPEQAKRSAEEQFCAEAVSAWPSAAPVLRGD